RRRTEARRVLADVAEHRADTLIVVPTVLQRLVGLGREALSAYDTSSLRIIVCGGSVLPPDLCRQVAAAFGDVLYNVYGSTEVANAAVATPAELRRAPGTVGRPLVGCRIALYDESRRPVTEPGRPGTIFAGNGLSFSGYTDGGGKETVDGLVCTGDVGHFDADGLLFIDGRADEMIVSGGENVFPKEVEDSLARHEAVVEVAAIGVDDDDFGQRLRAFVVLREGASASEEELKAHVRDNLARFKVPREIVILDELPRNATGKVLKRELVEYDAGSGADTTGADQP
ncbi:MAG TPA: AMP-binding protein, partial [Nocardioides sp.]|uniref:AMP-binding protein n=1 Tax=Nocardioides sp. TaxID=35761 RepID=UPI002E303398